MLDIERMLREDRLCKAVTGFSITEFNDLLLLFSTELYIARKSRANRKRAVGGGLLKSAHKLAFIY